MNEAENGFASKVLAGPLALVLGLLALAQLATWLPHYLTWPYWPDHDVFANAARSWDRGDRPYLDVRLNNFPGTVYVFYALGKLVGWGRPSTFQAFDATLVLTLVILLPVWGRRTCGWSLAGLIGSVAFLRYYQNLNYCLTAQRDWQAPGFAVIGLLVAQAWPGRASRFASAGLAAFAFSIRPQTVLLWPALLLGVVLAGEPVDFRSKLRRGGVWVATLAGLTAFLFLPLVVDGIFDDFLRSIRLVAYGSKYNQVGRESLAVGWLAQPGVLRWCLVALAIVWLNWAGEPSTRRVATPWLVALAGVSFYKPLSPMGHRYLDLPLAVIGSVILAVLAGSILSNREVSAKFRLVALVGLLWVGSSTLWPAFCEVGPSLRAWSTLRSGVEPEQPPPGYRRGVILSAAFYPWSDYRATLLYLRSQTGPTTRVANALKGMPAIASEVDRRSAFPAESLAWLEVVNDGDETAFIESLEKATDSVAIWSPGEIGPLPEFRDERLEAAIRRLYQFEVRFGTIEIWRRRAAP